MLLCCDPTQNKIGTAVVVAIAGSVGKSILHKHDEAVCTCPPPLSGPGVATVEVWWSHRGYTRWLGHVEFKLRLIAWLVSHIEIAWAVKQVVYLE